jgi:hypothetical protein
MFLALAGCLFFAGTMQADGLIYRLPADGTWARYTFTQTMVLPSKKKAERITVGGTLTLASVGVTKVEDKACRWVEIVVEAKLPDDVGTARSIFKALIPEQHLAKGQDPLKHWIKGWAKLGEGPAQPLTKELLSNPALIINLFVAGPLQETRKLSEKVVETTKLGKLTCEGIAGSFTLKGGAVSVKNDKVTAADVKVEMENYFHDKAPFGVAWSRIQAKAPDLGSGSSSAEAVLVLAEVGKDAKTELPDRK